MHPELSQQLLNANKRLQAVIDTVTDGVITIDEHSIIESINPAAARMFQYTEEEVIGQHVNVLLARPYPGTAEEFTRENVTDNGRVSREVWGIKKDGNSFPFHLSVSEVELNEQRVFIGTIHDLSKIKAVELKSQDTLVRLQTIIDTAIDGIITIDELGLIESVNPAAANMFGYELGEVIGQNITMLMAWPQQEQEPSYAQEHPTPQQALLTGAGQEVPGKRKDGTTFPLRLAVSETPLGAKRIFTGILHDLTQVKEAERRIREMNLDLEKKVTERTEELATVVNKLLITNKRIAKEITVREAAEAALRKSENEVRQALQKEKELGDLKSRFVSMASHEFRTPLSTILSSVSLIGRYETTEQQVHREKHIQRIKSSVANLTTILNDFLSVSKLEEGKIQLQKEPFEITELCIEVVDEIQSILKPGQQIQTSGLDDFHTVVLDRRLLKNILINLLSNAIKYSDENDSIDLVLAVKDQQLHITVKDQGIGIPEQDQIHLFGRFFRATNAATIKGTGLGLNLVKNYTELMGGQITFASKESEGTTFHLILPALDDPETIA